MDIGSNFSTLLTADVLRLLAELDEFKGSWRTLRVLTPERLDSLRKIATVESIGSSTRIEGVKLTDREIKTLLAGIKRQSFSSRDEQEVAGYAEVTELIFGSWESIPLTESHIKQLHRVLLKFSSKDEGHRGEYKKLSNDVHAFDTTGKSIGVVFQTASPFDTPQKMEELVAWVTDELVRGDLHPLLVIAVFVVTFLAIHPFQDGNGRLSRGLTTLLLLRAGYTYVPYSSLEQIIEANKESYYSALRKTQTTLNQGKPNWEPWLLFFLRAMQTQKQKLARKLEEEQQMQSSLPFLSVRILEIAREQGRITMQQLERATGESRSTIKVRLRELVRDNLLARHGKGRATWYTLS